MPYGYDETGMRIAPMSAEQRDAEMARIAARDEERQRSHRAWLRLCGSVAPIGRLSDR